MYNFISLLDGTAAPAPAGGGLMGTILMITVMLVLLYFIMIRPQKKQEKKDNEMRNSLSVGDEVTTIGGIIGRVVNVKEDTFVLETTRERTRIRFERTALRRIDRKFDTPDVEEAPAAVEAPAEEASEKDAKDTKDAKDAK